MSHNPAKMGPILGMCAGACVLIACLAWIRGYVAAPDAASRDDQPPPLFHPEIAGIIHEACAPCHRPGQSGPFSLLTLDDVRKRARQIREVVESGYMPPWLPSTNSLPFLNDRKLEPSSRKRLLSWFDLGMPVGDPDMQAEPPRFQEDWTLGKPDLVVDFPEPYTLAEYGRDIYRNFAVPVAIHEAKYVRTLEFKPDRASVIHHAVVLIDRTQKSLQLDALSPEPGFGGGMEAGNAGIPDGHFIGWTPGKHPDPGRDDMAWLLTPETTLVVQLHMRPSGKPERIQPALGLYFNATPPTIRPYALVLRNKSIDIPAGESRYRVSESYTLPVDVRLWGLYPHAHYLGYELQAFAQPPEGPRIQLIHIPRWDFNWQDEYRTVRPLTLRKGTVIEMNYTYDNSESNPFNPHSPPKRIRFGPNSDDEMAELMLQVVPGSARDWNTLAGDVARNELKKDLERKLRAHEDDPSNEDLLRDIAHRQLQLGQPGQAAETYQKLLERLAEGGDNGKVAEALLGLADCLETMQDLPNAVKRRFEAVQKDPENALARHLLGDGLARLGFFDEALEEMKQARRLNPFLGPNLNSLARIWIQHPSPEKREPGQALATIREALAMEGHQHDAVYLDTLGLVLAELGEFQEAISVLNQALDRAGSEGDDQSEASIAAHLNSVRQKISAPSRPD